MQFWRIFAQIGCHGNSLCSFENSDSIFEFADPEYHILRAKSVSICCTDLKSVQFWLIFAQIGCHGNSLCSPENSDSMFEFADPKRLLFTRKISRYVVQNWNQCNFGLFMPKLVAMATPFAPLKIEIAYLNSPMSKKTPYTQTVSRYLVQNWNQGNFGLFLPGFGCLGNSLCSLENLDTAFEFAAPKTLPYTQTVSISCTEMKLCLFECFAFLYQCGRECCVILKF